MLDRYKEIEVLMRLDASDINQLDLTRLVYIDYFNAWFYVDEIEQYKANKKESTLVKLIKI